MTTSQIVAEAKKRTDHLRAMLNVDIVRKLTIAEVAVIVDGMDESTAASVRIMRLNDAIYQVNADFAA